LEPAWEALKREFEAACLQSERHAQTQLIHQLNSLLRRFRQYETESEWVRLVLDGARPFAHQIALFSLENDILLLRGQVNLELPEDLSLLLAEAAAFHGVLTTKDPVAALRTPGEVGDALSASGTLNLAHLLPIVNGSRVAAILFVSAAEEMDLNGLEFVTGLASSILERKSNAALHAQIAVLPLTATPVISMPAPLAKPGAARLPAWADLAEEERQLHMRAQRYSRVNIAELQLAKPDACTAGRQQSNLYVFVAKEIDRAREIYRGRFMTIPSMVDYLHLELVRTAAEGDESKLGADYPGPLV
jgi:hypothetical protein